MGRPLLVHLHMFKNAGSTVDFALRNHFGDAFFEYDGGAAWHRIGADELRQKVAEHEEGVAMSSHQLAMPLPPVPGRDLLPLAFVREPLDRARSVWAFEHRQQAESPGALQAKRLPIGGYFRWRLDSSEISVVSDFQVGRLGSYKGGAQALPLAMERVRAETVGVVERMVESMVVAEHRLRPWFEGIDLAFVSRNVSPPSETGAADPNEEFLDRLGPALADELYERNARDLELHRLANRELNHRLTEVPELDAALVDFERRCSELAERSAGGISP